MRRIVYSMIEATDPVGAAHRRCRWSLVVAAALLLGGVSATAGRAQDNPHGDLGIDCAECHTTEGWYPLREPLGFDHAETGFSLVQGHAEAECVSCHESLVFSFVATACIDCHADPHRGELGFDCELCHTPAGWDNRRSVADFHSTTLFPLTGVHATLDCAACHRREPPFEYALTPTDCYSCHRDDFQNADPDHVAAGFPTECQFCHNTLDFGEVEFGGGFGFDHSGFFLLTGRHATLGCSDCHSGGFASTPSTCVGCHLADYNATEDPDHQAAGFGTNCEDCHGTSQWEGAVTNHPFAITGAHQALDCEDCHVNGVFAGTPTTCVGCHLADYNATTDPNHSQAGFGTNCEDCHTTSMWEGAQVNHNQFFPLTGAHTSLDCEECHAGGVFAGTPTQCYGCHKAEYNATTDPDHAAAGFPTSCEDCHNTTMWEGAQFNHSQFFQLTGAHKTLDCDECHGNGVYKGTPTDCYSCHKTEFNATTDPDHVAAGFPHDCSICHTTVMWEGATFPSHLQYFPIYTGKHRQGQVWNSCADCHPNPSNFQVFDCLACHPKAEMDDEHDEVPGYVYQSQACYNCHPTGEK